MGKDGVRVYNGILLSHKKKNGTMLFSATWRPWDYYTKWSQKEKCHMLSLIVESMAQMDLFANDKQTHRYWKHTYCYQRGKGRGEG